MEGLLWHHQEQVTLFLNHNFIMYLLICLAPAPAGLWVLESKKKWLKKKQTNNFLFPGTRAMSDTSVHAQIYWTDSMCRCLFYKEA